MSKHVSEEQPRHITKADQPGIWGLIFIDDLNNCWARYASRNQAILTERIRYYRESDNGQWEAGAFQVGGAFMRYNENAVLVVKRLLQDTLFRLKKELGATGRRVYEIRDTWPSADARLTMTLDLAGMKLVYRADGAGDVQLQWTGHAEYEHTGGGYSWGAITQHYDKEKRTTLYYLPPPSNVALAAMQGSCATAAGMYSFLFDPVPASPLGADRPTGDLAAKSVDYLSMSFKRELFPEVAQDKPPADSNWATGLMVPPGSVVFTGGVYSEPSGYYVAGFLQPPALEASTRSTQAEAPLSITPMLRVVGTGAGKQALTLEPAGVTAQWTLAGSAVGTLEHDSGQWFYHPPAVANPAVTLEVNNKTDVPAVVRSTLAFPVAADVITARAGARSASSTFVTVYAQETHYFKARLRSGKVQLILCYKNRQGNEVEVPAANTKWAVKEGNGTVNAEGVFTSASRQPTPFTVLMAEDVDTTLLYWAYIVLALPTLEPEQMIDYING
ncbi:MAG TPA: hypothetical protein VJS90_00155 [Pseudomonas sp.]|uniref:hypothetical protein n=1 Tax=Pseudomonas sp. TaxID=306 RepID=UPI002B46B6C5|nr:hypothetical protein [Pseudomonas sp.]HKS11426.1 hypothetical protein [Pseudomonas sp.]